MILENIENRFKEITSVDNKTDLSLYPITEHIGFAIRVDNKKDKGEVFTPLNLVDKMLEISKPEPDKYNMDLCAGHGQFTVRMLRKFTNEQPEFNLTEYLQNLHWFNELNIQSCKELLYIFGNDINLAIGPAQELKSYPSDIKNMWQKGIFIWNDEVSKWITIEPAELLVLEINQTSSTTKLNAKPLF